MHVIKGAVIAFSMYSRIPMPQFQWEEDDMKYAIAFLPFVGAVILGFIVLLEWAGAKLELNLLVKVALFGAIPLLVTGGFHVDGFLDVQDACNSYKSKEEKLEILKDPHIGAFAVIRLLLFSALWIAVSGQLIEKWDNKEAILLGFVFVMSRIGTALLSLFLPRAKKEGMLHQETKSTDSLTIGILVVELIISVLVMGWISSLHALTCVTGLVLFALYYRNKCMRNFGGVTGDTAGYFVVQSELLLLLAFGILNIIQNVGLN